MYTVYSIVLLKSITVYLIIHLKLERKVIEGSKTSLKSYCATGNTLLTHIFLMSSTYSVRLSDRKLNNHLLWKSDKRVSQWGSFNLGILLMGSYIVVVLVVCTAHAYSGKYIVCTCIWRLHIILTKPEHKKRVRVHKPGAVTSSLLIQRC